MIEESRVTGKDACASVDETTSSQGHPWEKSGLMEFTRKPFEKACQDLCLLTSRVLFHRSLSAALAHPGPQFRMPGKVENGFA